MATLWGVPYYETSAKLNLNVNAVFMVRYLNDSISATFRGSGGADRMHHPSAPFKLLAIVGYSSADAPAASKRRKKARADEEKEKEGPMHYPVANLSASSSAS